MENERKTHIFESCRCTPCWNINRLRACTQTLYLHSAGLIPPGTENLSSGASVSNFLQELSRIHKSDFVSGATNIKSAQAWVNLTRNRDVNAEQRNIYCHITGTILRQETLPPIPEVLISCSSHQESAIAWCEETPRQTLLLKCMNTETMLGPELSSQDLWI